MTAIAFWLNITFHSQGDDKVVGFVEDEAIHILCRLERQVGKPYIPAVPGLEAGVDQFHLTDEPITPLIGGHAVLERLPHELWNITQTVYLYSQVRLVKSVRDPLIMYFWKSVYKETAY